MLELADQNFEASIVTAQTDSYLLIIFQLHIYCFSPLVILELESINIFLLPTGNVKLC